MARRRPVHLAACGAAVAIGTVLLAAFVVAGGWGRADAATGPCVKHAKRFVVHAKRHGKRTRVARVKHYWTCGEAPAVAASPASTPATPAAAPAAPAPSTPAALQVPVLEAPTTVTPPSVSPTPQPQPEPEPNAVGVTAGDHASPLYYSYLPSRTTVRAGRLTVQLINDGEDAHNMLMEKVGPNDEPEGEPIKVAGKTEPGTQTTESVEVEAGTYRMWCSFENGKHAAEGMETHITVAE